MTDPLIEAMLAEPDNDEPRLVWADREGGDRGELVIVQCAIARGGLGRAELCKLTIRERELLAAARSWPEMQNDDGRTRFERGFVAHRPVSLDELEAHEQLFATTPLLRSIELLGVLLHQERGAALPDWDPVGAQITRAFENLPAGRIAHVHAVPFVRDESFDRVRSMGNELLAALSSTAPGRLLRGLHLYEPAELESLAPFEALEELTLAGSFPLSRLSELPLPRLRHLGFYGEGFVNGEPLRAFLGTPFAARLKGLDLSLNHLLPDDATAIASSPGLAGLTSLALDCASFGRRGVEAIASSPYLSGLRTVDLGDALRHLDVLVTATFAPRLRELRLDDALATPEAIAHLRAFPALERVVFRWGSESKGWLRRLENEIPCVVR